MKKNKIFIILAREFSTRVKKKSFILTTVLTPLLFAGLMIVPSLIMLFSSSDKLKLAVIDESGIVMPYLENTEETEFEQIKGKSLEQLKKDFDNLGVDAIIGISALDSTKNLSVSAVSKKQLNINVQSQIEKNIKKAVEDNKLKDYNIPNIDTILNAVKTNISIKTFKIGDDGKETESKVEIYMGIGYIASFMIYMFIFMFGSMVMRSVIEEKSTRIVEVIVSSVKPIQLMMGKILGVASVALTQFFIWIVLTLVIVVGASSFLGWDDIAKSVSPTSQIGSTMGLDSLQMAQASAQMPMANVELSGAQEFIVALQEIDYFTILSAFVVYFALGYLLYSSLFAAVGAAVDNEADTQQLILPITMPLIIGLFIMIHTFQYPDSSLSFWGSIIPFTSPMVMMARIAYGVPVWELALSIALLVVTFLAMAYVSAKIYRVGILMYGKKPSWKDLFKWLKY